MGCLKSKNKHVEVPWPLESNSRQEWIAWRNCFLTYMNEKYIPNYKQSGKFFEYIGSVGQDIAKNFYYQSSWSETDISTLLFKFDVYFIFGGRKRHENETVEEYLQALKAVAEKTAKSNTEKVIKEKILQDLKAERVFERFVELAPSFAKISDYELLALHELRFMWEECERFRDEKPRPALPRERCPRCDAPHQQGLRCAALGEQCSRCGKLSHFSWICWAEMIDCGHCGRSHVKDRLRCPANNSTCSNCHKIGHFTYKCRSRRNSRTRR